MYKVFPEGIQDHDEAETTIPQSDANDFWVLKMDDQPISSTALVPPPLELKPFKRPAFFKPAPASVPKVEPVKPPKIEDLEQEILHFLPSVSAVRHQDRYVLLTDEADVVNFKDIKKYLKQHPSRTRHETLLQFGHHPKVDAMVRILHNEHLDSCMTYKRFTFGKDKERHRYKFLELLLAEGIILTIDFSGGNEKKREVYLTCPADRLLLQAAKMKLKMRLTKAQIALHIKDFETNQAPPPLPKFSFSNTYKYEHITIQKRSAIFTIANVSHFQNDSISFFTSSQTNMLLHALVNSIPIPIDDTKEWHISDLLMKGLITRYYPLHSSSVISLKKHISAIWRIPVKSIRDYFGEEVGFFFAWMQYYCEWCLVVSIPGIAGIVYSLIFGKLSTFDSFLSLFDNTFSLLFAAVLNFSALLFLKFWKRRKNYLAFIWDVDEIELEDSTRMGWKPNEIVYSDVTGEMTPHESFKSVMTRRTISNVCLFICILFLIGTVSADVALQSYLANNLTLGVPFLDSIGPLMVSVYASVVDAIVIVICGIAFDSIALVLIEVENHKTMFAHLDRYIWMQFIIQFINCFGLMIFLAIIKPIFYQVAPSFSYFFGPLKCENQGTGSSCMRSLVLNISIIFIIQQFSLLILGWMSMLYFKYSSKQKEKFLKCPNDVDKKLTTITHESFEKEYNSLILQFGYLVLFSSAFPLGPILALLNNTFQSKLSLNQYFYRSNRPFAVQTKGIGPWERIQTSLVYFGIIVNSLSLPFISDGFVFTSNYLKFTTSFQYQQIIFVLLYENMLLVAAVLIDWLVDDVPESVRVGRLAEKYIAQDRLKKGM